MSAASLINATKQRVKNGELVLCMALRQARTVDMEHCPVDLETTSAICVAALGAGVTPLVRVPCHDAHVLSRVLDGGAQGIIVPHVNTADEAQAVVACTRFSPQGKRSVMGSGPAVAYRALPLAEINALLNAQTLLIAMLETPMAIANADAIAAVDGIDILLIGSNDLCTEMGIPGELHHPRLRETYASVARACASRGKALGVGGIRGDTELQRELVGLGARFIIAGSDVQYLMNAARKDVQALREIMI
jgi:2-keto-3-deoxy-L-rhamnonate aldolase RhmA